VFIHHNVSTLFPVNDGRSVTKLRLILNSLWIQKSVLLVFYRVLVQDIPWGRKTVPPFWGILGSTYITDIIVTFTGCRPFDHYWKVLPQTGMTL
jgi:hypothetical protein